MLFHFFKLDSVIESSEISDGLEGLAVLPFGVWNLVICSLPYDCG